MNTDYMQYSRGIIGFCISRHHPLAVNKKKAYYYKHILQVGHHTVKNNHFNHSKQGYKQKDAYIATQGPLQNTVEDFWRMMWEYQCGCIVMLCELEEDGQV